MDNDPIWQSASANQLDLARVVVERTVMARVYHNALYLNLNEDGDVYRDQLFHGHINKLAKVVTSNHRDLRISKVYHYECPWSWAQAELAVISAYKTPRDKLQCVLLRDYHHESLFHGVGKRHTCCRQSDSRAGLQTNPPSLYRLFNM
ncbi:GTPase-activating protein and VPS9 domain-containing protein 1-like isoform X1 [Temnothorax curvispinosus]|uniref:GTPase-activating protein and VPS9 domain-containing protein 1-like isoform X1 n=1 Tax=Temnothorax curvispinosus TaxID=300111 RepID=A0A6J1RDL8_9HYME|nr:GTPase-activating protein and VPS9 domain-containing protein 1-like isoform X1 [Temnothorax curvispinosus]